MTYKNLEKARAKRIENRKKVWKKKHSKKEQINLRINQSERNMIIALMYLGKYNSMSEAILSAVAHELEDLGHYNFAKEEIEREIMNAKDERFKEFALL